MEEMETKYGRDSETVMRWRKALWEGGNLIGIPLVQGQDEGYVVQQVVERVFKTLNRVPLEVAKYPVGIDRCLRAMRTLLRIDPHVNDVCMIGLHGQGGAGKTTLSKAICNDIADRFDSWCFLPNVRETTSRDCNGLAQLQQRLLHALLNDEGLKVWSVDAGKQLIKGRLCNKRVLVILDDVDESDQLDALAGDWNWFGKGSRIIVTTRNKHVLTSYRMHVYEVKLLKKDEADHLFRLHAFGEKQEKIKIDGGLIDRFVEYAGQLPLALVVLGAFLRSRSECEWEGKLKELAKSPDTKINSVLKVSFEGLEESHQEMFLDVACFYKGWKIDQVKKILDSCGFVSSVGVPLLIERCLVTVADGEVQMHDLVESMGQSIVRGEYSKGRGMLSRIWLYDDLVDILSEDRSVQEREAVKGIVVDFKNENDAVLVKPNALKGFKKLRVLIVRTFWKFILTEKLVQLPRELRWVHWDRCSASVVEFDPSSKVVCLDLWDCKIKEIKAKGLEEIKYLHLPSCYSLETLPDLSECRKLEDLTLTWCMNLKGLDEAVGSLENLVNLDLGSCTLLMTVPSSLRSKRFQTLDFHSCLRLKKFPAIIEEHKFLKSLNLSGTTVKELPDSIRNLAALKILTLCYCEELTTIPSSIYELRALQMLDVGHCQKLSVFPRNSAGASTDSLGFPNLVSLLMDDCRLKDLEFLNDLTCFETLKKLDLSSNEFAHVSVCISKFKNLEVLQLNCCHLLVEVTELPNVPNLCVADCGLLKTFPDLHTFICQSPRMIEVDLSNCHSLDRGYIDRSLPLERVRGFNGEVDVLYPGDEFPSWVNYENRECSSCYSVSLPPKMSKSDLLGLALFISLKPLPGHILIGQCSVNVRVDGMFLEKRRFPYAIVGVHSWFFYIPGQSLDEGDRYFATELNRRGITLKISADYLELQRWGFRILWKGEKDEDGIKVCKGGDNEDHSWDLIRSESSNSDW